MSLLDFLSRRVEEQRSEAAKATQARKKLEAFTILYPAKGERELNGPEVAAYMREISSLKLLVREQDGMIRDITTVNQNLQKKYETETDAALRCAHDNMRDQLQKIQDILGDGYCCEGLECR